ncbi:ankyrin repeat protein [Aspergillus luchuensis IFO 4308]|nr:ankyrin repeat protein [Aspergillus luchuensis IFO 4308]
MPLRFDPSVYTVGWVCAIKDEVTASRAFLDEEHEQPRRRQNDNNVYIVGRMGEHKVVIAFPGAGSYGADAIAHTVANMVRTFRNIRFGLMVGIGGAAPSAPDPKDPLNDIRLGDVVVSEPKGNYTSHNNQGGVLQYDKGRWKDNGFEIRSHMNKPPKLVLAAMKLLQSDHDIGRGKMTAFIDDIHKSSQLLAWDFRFPGRELDRLYKPDLPHSEGKDFRDYGLEVLEKRLYRETDEPVVHYGIIASANAMMRSVVYRNYLRDTWGVCCFETEAAGLMNDLPCVVIRGIANYSDGHKYDNWQRYAAVTAAAYAKDLLRVVPAEEPGSTGIPSQISEDFSWELREVGKRVAKLDDMITHNHNETILGWLNDFPYDIDNCSIFDGIHPGTGQWLLNSDKFQSWYQAKGQTLLCLGIPGAGKTVMAATIMGYINTHRHVNNLSHALGYVFFSFRYPSQQRTRNIVASILKQLAQQDRQLMQGLQTLYGRHSTRGTQPSTREMVEILCSMSSDRQVYIVIDALDEIQSPMKGPTNFLSELFRIQDATGLNILATSLFAPGIQKIFRERDGCSSLEIRATDEDVRSYIQGNITSLPSFVTQDQAMMDRILEEVPRAASGMFHFAKLCLDSLSDQVSPKRMHQALAELSNNSELQKLAYEKTMERIEAQSPNLRKLALDALSWIVCVGRPLNIRELQHALAIQTGSQSVDTEDVVDAILIVSVCAGLVSVDMESEVVHLVHHTAQGFINNRLEEWFPNAHRRIAETCVTYLSCDWNMSQDAATIVSQHPFYRYAAQYWDYHSRLDPVSDELLLPLLMSKEKVALYAQYMRLLDSRSSDVKLEKPQDITRLHLAAYFGLTNIAKELVKNGGNLDAKDSWGRNVFAWAAEYGRKELFECFYDHVRLWHQKDKFGVTPLQLALLKSHTDVANILENRHVGPEQEKITTPEDELMCEVPMGNQISVEALLCQGVSPNCQQGRRTPLHMAIVGGHLAVGQALLKKGADPNMVDWYGRTPLHYAAGRGREEFVKLLLDYGVDINLKDNNGATPLIRAVAGRHDSIVRLLLDYKPQLDSQDNFGETALIYAVRRGSDEAFSLLLRNGSSLNIQCRKGMTALIRAALVRDVEKARLLLAAKPQIDIRNETGATALICASRKGCYKIVDALIQNGAHLDIEDNDGQTALLFAMRYNHEAVTALLIQSGANVEAGTDKEGWSPLYQAVDRSWSNIVRQLVAKGADVNRQDVNGITALIYGSRSCYDEMVIILLESGADWKLRDNEGRTALFYAHTKCDSFSERQDKRDRIIQAFLPYEKFLDGTEAGNEAAQSDDGTACEDKVVSGSE